jgi:hypothetical protein
MQVSLIQKSIVATLGALAMLGTSAGAGQAFTFNEATDGDAGALPRRAADLGFLTGSDTILGSVSDSADLFKFTVATAGEFTASTFVRTGGNILADPQLFLFNSLGQGLTGNDDDAGLQAKITYALTAGTTYYLGLSGYDRDPRGAAEGDFIFDADNSTVNNPNRRLRGWQLRDPEFEASEGPYGITLVFTPTPTPVPTPALLPGLAALGFSAIRKRKAKAAVA